MALVLVFLFPSPSPALLSFMFWASERALIGTQLQRRKRSGLLAQRPLFLQTTFPSQLGSGLAWS